MSSLLQPAAAREALPAATVVTVTSMAAALAAVAARRSTGPAATALKVICVSCTAAPQLNCISGNRYVHCCNAQCNHAATNEQQPVLTTPLATLTAAASTVPLSWVCARAVVATIAKLQSKKYVKILVGHAST